MIRTTNGSRSLSLLGWTLILLAIGLACNLGLNLKYHDSLTAVDVKEALLVDSLFKASIADRKLLHAEVDSLRARVARLENW